MVYPSAWVFFVSANAVVLGTSHTYYAHVCGSIHCDGRVGGRQDTHNRFGARHGYDSCHRASSKFCGIRADHCRDGATEDGHGTPSEPELTHRDIQHFMSLKIYLKM